MNQMDAERRRRIEGIYQEALKLDASERTGFVAQACGDDVDLRKQIEALLTAEGLSTGLLNHGEAWRPEAAVTATVLGPGSRFGPYVIEAALGAGGMGQVFRAHDSRLGRKVAIKILNSRFLDRSEREARAIAALNHPNICTIYEAGANYLAMEFIEGETLAARVGRGALRMEELVRYGVQICGALASAHAKGIIHRDLKPANIMLTKAGVKVLDFGLAKFLDEAGDPLTVPGLVIGTPAYMAPEQFAGGLCDQRTDIYALGLILSEMATGKRGAGAKLEPQPFAHVVERCLAADPDDRWQSALDLKAELEWSALTSAAVAQHPSPKRVPRAVFVYIPAALALALLVWAGQKWLGSRPRPQSVVRLSIALPEGGSSVDQGNLSGPAVISPDGQMVALQLGAGAKQFIWTRRLDAERFEQVPGSEGGKLPFWSPDGKQLAFFAGDKLRKITLHGGTVETICETPTTPARGGAWSSTGAIVFGVNFRGLMRVSAQGGEPVQISGLDESIGENSPRFPQFLPDGNRFIYFSRTEPARNHALYLDALDSIGKKPRKKIAVTDGASLIWQDPLSGRDVLLFPSEGHLWAQPIDLSAGRTEGQKVFIAEDPGEFSISQTGTLVLRGSNAPVLTWMSREGKTISTAGVPGDYWDLRLSPDERQLAVMNHRSSDGTFWVQAIDLQRNVATVLSDIETRSFGLAWSRDGSEVYFTSAGIGQDRGFYLFRRPLNAASLGPSLSVLPGRYVPHDLSPDGTTLIGDHELLKDQQQTGATLAGAPLSSLAWTDLPQTSTINTLPQFSPDGKWIAYQAKVSGRSEVYVTDFPAGQRSRQMSLAGGAQPRWSSHGKELFYLAPDGAIWSAGTLAAIDSGTQHPMKLFQSPVGNATSYFQYDVTHDGQRFLTVNPKPDNSSQFIHVIINWPELLRQAQGN